MGYRCAKDSWWLQAIGYRLHIVHFHHITSHHITLLYIKLYTFYNRYIYIQWSSVKLACIGLSSFFGGPVGLCGGLISTTTDWKQKLHSAGQRPSQSDPFGVAVQELEGLDGTTLECWDILRIFEICLIYFDMVWYWYVDILFTFWLTELEYPMSWHCPATRLRELPQEVGHIGVRLELSLKQAKWQVINTNKHDKTRKHKQKRSFTFFISPFWSILSCSVA